jgi:hypothetical protein
VKTEKMELITKDDLKAKIFTIRGIQVMLDRDLALLYGVQTKVLNQAVKRNKERFPESFAFTLNKIETLELVTNCDRLKSLKHASSLPHVFTEQGIAMLSTVIRSETAIKVSIQIMETFVRIRKQIKSNDELIHRLIFLEKKQHFTEEKVDFILKSMESERIPQSKGIFFEGQLFDAYVFANELIKSAKHAIILIDNYIDETTLLMLSKRNPNCKAIIYTSKISSQLQLDLAKHNEQYPTIEIKQLKTSHDRFLILDEKELYHLGASLKDLGKKWFAFSKINEFLMEVLEKIFEP